MLCTPKQLAWACHPVPDTRTQPDDITGTKSAVVTFLIGGGENLSEEASPPAVGGRLTAITTERRHRAQLTAVQQSHTQGT